MKVTIHKLFDYLLETAGGNSPDCVLGFSLSQSPPLGTFCPIWCWTGTVSAFRAFPRCGTG